MPYHPTICCSWNPSTTGQPRVRAPKKGPSRDARPSTCGTCPNGCPDSLGPMVVVPETEVNETSHPRPSPSLAETPEYRGQGTVVIIVTNGRASAGRLRPFGAVCCRISSRRPKAQLPVPGPRIPPCAGKDHPTTACSACESRISVSRSRAPGCRDASISSTPNWTNAA